MRFPIDIGLFILPSTRLISKRSFNSYTHRCNEMCMTSIYITNVTLKYQLQLSVAFLIKLPEFIQIIINSRQLYTPVVSWVTTPVVAKLLREIAPHSQGRCTTTSKMKAECPTEKFVTTRQNKGFHKPENTISHT